MILKFKKPFKGSKVYQALSKYNYYICKTLKGNWVLRIRERQNQHIIGENTFMKLADAIKYAQKFEELKPIDAWDLYYNDTKEWMGETLFNKFWDFVHCDLDCKVITFKLLALDLLSCDTLWEYNPNEHDWGDANLQKGMELLSDAIDCLIKSRVIA